MTEDKATQPLLEVRNLKTYFYTEDGTVRAVDGVVFDAGRPFLADGAFFGAGRVGGAHEFTQVGDGVFFLQCQRDDGAAGHEVG